jgi:hypothetical protein
MKITARVGNEKWSPHGVRKRICPSNTRKTAGQNHDEKFGKIQY